jgi:predicted alpha/beta superfamily hydrolase
MKFRLHILIIFLLISVLPALAQKKVFPLGITDSLFSQELNEGRIVNIYLPPGYHPDSAARYPVIYLLDGSADEDFIHITGLVQFFNFPWIDRVPPSIIVGIANTNRRRDFTHPAPNLHYVDSMGFNPKVFTSYGGSKKFISFIEKELQPFIDKNYRTNKDRMLIGQSLGGLLATEILLTKPNLFNKYMIFSPSLWWDNGSLIKKTSGQIEGTPAVYIGVGNEGDRMVGDAKKLSEILRTKNPAMKVHYDYLPEEDHATMTHQAAYNAFRLLYPQKKQK